MLPAKTLSPGEIAAIRFEYLTDDTATIKTLSEKWNQPNYKVSSLLKGPEYDAFREQVQTSLTHNAKDILHRSAERAAELWSKSMVPAALKGDHRPMKDLLTAVHAIDPDSHAPAITIQIGIAASDVTILSAVTPTPTVTPVPALHAVDASILTETDPPTDPPENT